MTPSASDRVAAAVEAIQRGGMVVVIDDPLRENEGDLVMAGQHATPDAVNFMARYGRGLICVPMTEDRLRALHLPQMVERPDDYMGTAFTISVDARHGTTTGISAGDRARTIAVLCDPDSEPADLLRPGHVFPLAAKPGGILKRPGHTEAAIDLTRLAGLAPVGVICEILHDDGTMMRADDLRAFAAAHHLPVLFIADLVRHRRAHEHLVNRVASAPLRTTRGPFMVHVYEERLTGQGHVALTLGEVATEDPCLVRVHSECVTGDVLGSLDCACGLELAGALDAIAAEGRGVLLYMQPEHRTVGLADMVRAYATQSASGAQDRRQSHSGLRPDPLDIGAGAAILADLGVRRIRLLSNHPRSIPGLDGYGLEVTDTTPIPDYPAAKGVPTP